MDWDKLRIFYAVAQAGSFTKAGENLNLSQSAVSRQVSALEESLSVPLFHRHARGLIPTEQGDILYRTVMDVFSKLTAAENAIADSKDRPKGPLKITAPVALGTTWLVPRLPEFMEMYPDITVSLVVDDRELDLAMREADVAIRLFPSKQPDLIQRHLMTVHNGIYASNDYLRRYGIPADASELDRHKLIIYGEDVRQPFANINWLLKIGAGPNSDRKAILRVNNLPGMLTAVTSGIGVASLPDYMAQGLSGVTRILNDLNGPVAETHLVYTTEMRNSKRIKVFRDFLVRKIAESRF
ncbi:MAG: LysR family transcriptional regulator [Alphaproteobacteria bacterium]|nr:LysR family transcriptional regulator [Alphaproteobacteria bacterium]